MTLIWTERDGMWYGYCGDQTSGMWNARVRETATHWKFEVWLGTQNLSGSYVPFRETREQNLAIAKRMAEDLAQHLFEFEGRWYRV